MELDKKWRIVVDSGNMVLQFHEERERKKKDGSIEIYEYNDNYYYPTLKDALKSYLNKSINDNYHQVYEVLDRISEVEEKIDILTNNLNK